MTEEQFKEFAERIASEDETRIALRNAFRWEGYSIVSDRRIALVVEKAFESLPVAEGSQESVARSLLNEILPQQSKDEWVPFDLDIDLLGRAAAETAQNIAPEMEELRHYKADPDDPDDMDSEESERYVLTMHTCVIMPDQRRSVIAGYYASVIADICKGCTTSVCASKKSSNKVILFNSSDWQIAIMPIRMDGVDRSYYANRITGKAVADAKPGKLVWRRSYDECQIDMLRFRKERGDESPRIEQEVVK